MKEKWLYIVKILILAFLSCICYVFSLNGEFVFDDSEAIVMNKDVIDNSFNLFYNDFWGTEIKSNFSHKSYRPFTVLSFRFNYYLNGKQLDPYQFKLTNLLLHIICTLLSWEVFKTIDKLRGKIDRAFYAAMIFAVHPIHTESVAGIVGRADILAGITFSIAFILYRKFKRRRKVVLIVVPILAGISMLFKETGITVLGVCIALDSLDIIGNNLARKRKTIIPRPLVIRLVALFFSTIVLVYIRLFVISRNRPQFHDVDNPAAFATCVFTRFLSYNYIYFLNLQLLIYPQWSCYDWSMGCIELLDTMFDYRFVLVLIMYLYIIYATCYLGPNLKKGWKAKRFIIIGWLLVIIPFLPATNIFYTVGFVIAERLLYIPSIGYCYIIAHGMDKLCRIHNGRYSKPVKFMFLILVTTFSLRTYVRSSQWQSESVLYNTDLQVCYKNAKLHYNVAKINDNIEMSIQQYKDAIRLYPKYYQAMNNLANVLKDQGKFKEAEYYLRKALGYNDKFPAAWMNLGIVLANLKHYNESVQAYQTAIYYRRNYPDCYYNLGNAYLEMKEEYYAIESWRAAIKLNPKHQLAWTNLLALLDNTDQAKLALKILPEALANLPNVSSIHFVVANIKGKLDLYQEAEEHFMKAIELNTHSKNALHYANLGVLYHRWKKYKKAEEMYTKALEINPYLKSANENLNTVKMKLRT